MEKYKCFKCSQTFNIKNDVAEHLRNHNLDDDDCFKCSVNFSDNNISCNKEFKTLRSLFVHMDLCILHQEKFRSKQNKN